MAQGDNVRSAIGGCHASSSKRKRDEDVQGMAPSAKRGRCIEDDVVKREAELEGGGAEPPWRVPENARVA